VPRSSERGHPRTARRFRSPSRRGVTSSQPHARNSVASLRLTRLPEPRSVIRLLFLLRYHRPAKSPPSSLGKQILPRSRLSRVCSTLCRVVHPLLRIVALRGSPSTPQRVDPILDPAHHPLRPTRTWSSRAISMQGPAAARGGDAKALEWSQRHLCLSAAGVGHPSAVWASKSTSGARC